MAVVPRCRGADDARARPAGAVPHLPRRESHMRNNRRARGGRSPARGARWRILPVIAAITAFLCVGVGAAAAASLDSWPSASQSVLGERTQPLEFTINPQNVSHLKPKWVFTMNGSQGESATPTVADGVVYFPDWNG